MEWKDIRVGDTIRLLKEFKVTAKNKWEICDENNHYYCRDYDYDRIELVSRPEPEPDPYSLWYSSAREEVLVYVNGVYTSTFDGKQYRAMPGVLEPFDPKELE